MVDRILMGAKWCPPCQRVKDFLYNKGIDYLYVDIDYYYYVSQTITVITITTILTHSLEAITEHNHRVDKFVKIGDKPCIGSSLP